jgi:hypothetical protein
MPRFGWALGGRCAGEERVRRLAGADGLRQLMVGIRATIGWWITRAAAPPLPRRARCRLVRGVPRTTAGPPARSRGADGSVGG